jgi:hypothetical protein
MSREGRGNHQIPNPKHQRGTEVEVISRVSNQTRAA